MKHDRFKAVNRSHPASRGANRGHRRMASACHRTISPYGRRDVGWSRLRALFTLAQFTQDEVYTRAAQATADIVPSAVRSASRGNSTAPPGGTEAIRRRVEPMVTGLVQRDWQEVALREIVPRTFDAEFSGNWRPLTQSCRPVPWDRRGGFWGPCLADYELKPGDVEMRCDGIAGDCTRALVSL